MTLASTKALVKHALAAVAALSLFATAACGDPEDAADDVEGSAASTAEELSVPDVFGGRIAMARFYQHNNLAFPKTELGERLEQLIHVDPTYVSGLVRLDADDELTTQHIAAYAAVHESCPEARVDIVLNATQYATWSALEKRLTNIDQGFRAAGMAPPDVFFFDFYSQGKKDVMESAIKWAHDAKRKQKVGGTFWKTKDVPNDTDFLVLDDHDGLDQMVQQGKQLRANYAKRYPLLAHVENNPGQAQTGDDHRNLGLEWVHGKLDPVKYIQQQANAQRKGGFLLMYPVAFPLDDKMNAWNPAVKPGYLDVVKRLMK